MSAKPARLRGLAAVTAWCAVTAVAAAGSWLGMSTVLTGQRAPASAATVVTPSTDASSSVGSASPRARTEPTTTSSPAPRKDWNGWALVDDDTYERAFDTDGGSTVIQLRPGEAVFVSASPAEGYTARRQWPSPEHLVVSFHKANSLVTVDTMWRDGEPFAQVSET